MVAKINHFNLKAWYKRTDRILDKFVNLTTFLIEYFSVEQNESAVQKLTVLLINFIFFSFFQVKVGNELPCCFIHNINVVRELCRKRSCFLLSSKGVYHFPFSRWFILSEMKLCASYVNAQKRM